MGLSHIDREGKARMVDVSEKPLTAREAAARGSVCMKPETIKLIKEKAVPKGDVITVAKVAAIMAAKKIDTTETMLAGVGKKIKELRISAGYSSYETFAHDYDLDRKQYWRIENGANLTLRTLKKILSIHQMSLADFFKGVD